MLATGAAFVLVGMLVRSAFFGPVFAPLVMIGWLLLAIGAMLALLTQRHCIAAALHNAAPLAPPSGRARPASARPDWRGATNVIDMPPPRAPAPRPRTHGTADADADAVARVLSKRLDAAATHAREAAPLTRWNAAVFDAIEWRRFEAVVEVLFQQAGFHTRSQSHGADAGVDVWLYSAHEPGMVVSIVQCKHWTGKPVGVDKVRELRGVMAGHNVRRGQFATTSTFTPEARAFANANNISLLDINGLLGLIAQRAPAQQEALLAVALQGDYWLPTCVNCGVKMLARTPRKGGTPFWGCRNYPGCKTTLPMRERQRS